MAGRPKKKPEYNPELQFNHFLQELRRNYPGSLVLPDIARLLKLRRLSVCAAGFRYRKTIGIGLKSARKMRQLQESTLHY